jgi:hypothetical protein
MEFLELHWLDALAVRQFSEGDSREHNGLTGHSVKNEDNHPRCIRIIGFSLGRNLFAQSWNQFWIFQRRNSCSENQYFAHVHHPTFRFSISARNTAWFRIFGTFHRSKSQSSYPHKCDLEHFISCSFCPVQDMDYLMTVVFKVCWSSSVHRLHLSLENHDHPERYPASMNLDSSPVSDRQLNYRRAKRKHRHWFHSNGKKMRRSRDWPTPARPKASWSSWTSWAI